MPSYERTESSFLQAQEQSTLLALMGGATIGMAWFVLAGGMKSGSNGFSVRRYCVLLSLATAIEQGSRMCQPGLLSDDYWKEKVAQDRSSKGYCLLRNSVKSAMRVNHSPAQYRQGRETTRIQQCKVEDIYTELALHDLLGYLKLRVPTTPLPNRARYEDVLEQDDRAPESSYDLNSNTK
jgi:hypothetical protein